LEKFEKFRPIGYARNEYKKIIENLYFAEGKKNPTFNTTPSALNTTH
jgi:hypothetical protein